MQPSSLAELRQYFIRPASITVRFTDQNVTAYQEAAAAYNDLLTNGKATSTQQREATSYYFYQFEVNRGANSEQEVELRLEHRTEDSPELQNRTIIYWQIEDDKLDIIKDKLRRLHYQLLEEDKITAAGKAAQRFIAQSPTGNLIAGHTNPPFPLMKHLKQQFKSGSNSTATSSLSAQPERSNDSTSSSNTQLTVGISLAVVVLGVAVLLRLRGQ